MSPDSARLEPVVEALPEPGPAACPDQEYLVAIGLGSGPLAVFLGCSGAVAAAAIADAAGGVADADVIFDTHPDWPGRAGLFVWRGTVASADPDDNTWPAFDFTGGEWRAATPDDLARLVGAWVPPEAG